MRKQMNQDLPQHIQEIVNGLEREILRAAGQDIEIHKVEALFETLSAKIEQANEVFRKELHA